MIVNMSIYFSVDVRLHEPLLSRDVTPIDTEIEMMSLCSQLDILCHKELKEVTCSCVYRATHIYTFQEY